MIAETILKLSFVVQQELNKVLPFIHQYWILKKRTGGKNKEKKHTGQHKVRATGLVPEAQTYDPVGRARRCL